MTLPSQRTTAVLSVHDFLCRLASPYGGGIKGIKREVRAEARRLLRHYPTAADIWQAGEACPAVFDTQAVTVISREEEDAAIKDKRLQALEALSKLDQELGLDNMAWRADLELHDCKLVCTCSACPEQYDVFDPTGAKIGYLRLRHGHFRADYPECGGERVYESRPKGDGIFDADERLPELTKAVHSLLARHAQKNND